MLPSFEEFSVIWLDATANDLSATLALRSHLKSALNHLIVFDNSSECVDFIQSRNATTDKLFLITSGQLGEQAVPIIHELQHVLYIYVFCIDIYKHSSWSQNFSKVHGLFSDMKPLIDKLSIDIQNLLAGIPPPFAIYNIEKSFHDVTKELASFMWSQLLIDVLINIPQSDLSKKDMLEECRQYYKDNEIELKKIAKFDTEYQTIESIYWYTLDSFVYRLLNKALRTQDIDTIFKFRFFISALYHQLHDCYRSCTQSIDKNVSNNLTVYRGQGMTTDEFTKIKNSVSSYVALNTFFSTTRDSNMAIAYSGNGLARSRGIESVVFEIDIDKNLEARPYADISHISYMKENEVLFSIGTVFKIADVYEITPDIWFVKLSMCTNEAECKINKLRDYLKHEISYMSPEISLGYLLQSMGHYDKAEKYYQMIVDCSSSIFANELSAYNGLGILEYKRGNYAMALDYFHKAYVRATITNSTSVLTIIHLNFGNTYFILDDFEQAVAHFEEAVKLQTESSVGNSLQWADAYSCLAMASNSQADYQAAKDYFSKSLAIYIDKLPLNHPRLADIYNNIASLHSDLGEYRLAKENYEKALDIQLIVLPDGHPSLGETYNNLGAVHAILGEYELALNNYQRSLEIRLHTLSDTHPSIANVHTNIGTLQFDQGNYVAALKSYKQCLQIQLLSLYPNHLLVAGTHNSIGSTLVKLKRFDEALMHFGKALQIRLDKLPEYHPHIANTYSGLGTVYFNLSQNTTALMHFEKALNIRLKVLPSMHKDLAEVYMNIGVVYDRSGDYLKALDMFQKCLEIQCHLLKRSHLSIAITMGNIGRTHFNMGHYDEAIINYLQVLEIFRSSIPTNNHYLSVTYSNMAAVLEAIGNYKDALEVYEKSFRINLSLHENDTAACISDYAMTILVCCRIGKLCNWNFN